MAESSKKSNTHEEDLISKLPDEILSQILSYINTNSAVATSVLSKRWKLVWASVPNLEFDNKVACLENLVDRVLSLNNVVSVRNLVLDCHDCDVLRVAAWLKSLGMRKAERCDLYLPFRENMLMLPDGFFTRQHNLVELRLTNVAVKVPPTLCFPCLGTIDFIDVKLVGDDTMENLLAGCPVIMELFIRSEKWDHHKKLNVCSSTLRTLTLRISCDDIGIDAPYLVKACLWIRTGRKILHGLLGKSPHVEQLTLKIEYTTGL